MATEVHVYALAIAASALLAFVPFLIVMLSLCQNIFHWQAAANAIYFSLGDYFPGQMGEFITRNLRVIVGKHHIQAASIILLLFTANGIFIPLEVGLNRSWRCRANRSYFRNQIISMLLIFLCGGAFLLSVTLTAINAQFLTGLSGWSEVLGRIAGVIVLKAAAVPLSMLTLFLIYWLLPNCKVPWRGIAIPAIVVGLLLELLKYVNYVTWPWFRLKLESEYTPFQYSVAIILYAFAASMIVLTGAEWAGRRHAENPEEPPIASERISR
jgi:uncharacterized BrkB/YihY/UPF0761 family membrane protein